MITCHLLLADVPCTNCTNVKIPIELRAILVVFTTYICIYPGTVLSIVLLMPHRIFTYFYLHLVDFFLGNVKIDVPYVEPMEWGCPTWRIIPVSKWLVTMVSKSPK